MDQKANHAYRAQTVLSASPAEQVVMLYDQVIRSLERAVAAIGEGDIEGRWRANNNASECLWELVGALDMEQGGEIARYLEQLYQFMLGRLPEIDIRNDAAIAREVIELLRPLRDTWKQIAVQQADAAPAAEPSRDAEARPPETPRVAISA